MVSASRGAAYDELADAIDALSNPPALTIVELMAVAPALEWLRDHSKRRATAYRLTECHYIAADNPNAKDGLWKINGRRQTIYVRADIPSEQRIDVAAAHHANLVAKGSSPGL